MRAIFSEIRVFGALPGEFRGGRHEGEARGINALVEAAAEKFEAGFQIAFETQLFAGRDLRGPSILQNGEHRAKNREQNYRSPGEPCPPFDFSQVQIALPAFFALRRDFPDRCETARELVK